MPRHEQRCGRGQHLERESEIEVIANRPFAEEHLSSLRQVHEMVVREFSAEKPEEEREDEGESAAGANHEATGCSIIRHRCGRSTVGQRDAALYTRCRIGITQASAAFCAATCVQEWLSSMSAQMSVTSR